MNRRDFLQRTALGSLALTLPRLPDFAAEKRMGLVVHSYGFRWHSIVPSQQYPGFATALDLLEHCHQLGAGGIQVVVGDWSKEFAGKVRDAREKYGMYLEGSIGLPKDTTDVARFEKDLSNAKEAGATVLRTVCSSGRRYETYHSVAAFDTMKKDALTSLQLAEPILRKHRVKLGVENHKDFLAHELVTLLKQVNSEWIGTTIDFGNSIALLEDPMTVVQTLAPYAVSTHVKDMGLEQYPSGFLLSEVPLGKGILDLPRMMDLCRKHDPAVTFSLEMITRDPLEIPCLSDKYWETFGPVRTQDMTRTLLMAQQRAYTPELPRVSQRSPDEKLAAEEANIVACLNYSKTKLGLG